MSAKTLGYLLGCASHSDISVSQIAKLLNYIPDELEKDMICAYNFTADPPYLNQRAAENTRHLMSVILRYSEDDETMKRVAVWLGGITPSRLTSDAEKLTRTADAFLANRMTQTGGITL